MIAHRYTANALKMPSIFIASQALRRALLRSALTHLLPSVESVIVLNRR
jgi:hypothetical protein